MKRYYSAQRWNLRLIKHGITPALIFRLRPQQAANYFPKTFFKAICVAGKTFSAGRTVLQSQIAHILSIDKYYLYYYYNLQKYIAF